MKWQSQSKPFFKTESSKLLTAVAQLTSFDVDCGPNGALTHLKFGEAEVEYACRHVAGLGGCYPEMPPQVDWDHTFPPPLTCSGLGGEVRDDQIVGEDFLQSFQLEAGADWTRFRFVCCKSGGAPVVMQPVKTALDHFEAFEGVYAPVHKDMDSGMLRYDRHIGSEGLLNRF